MLTEKRGFIQILFPRFNLRLLMLVYSLLLYQHADAGDTSTYFDTSCTCSQESSNANYCVAWACRTDQKQKCFSGRSTVTTKDGFQKQLQFYS